MTRLGRLLLLALTLLAGAAVGAAALSLAAGPAEREARGVLIEVRGSSIMYAESVVLRTDDGRILPFKVHPEVATNPEHPQSASHLRQHMTFGEPMVVRYRETDGPTAYRIVDGG